MKAKVIALTLALMMIGGTTAYADDTPYPTADEMVLEEQAVPVAEMIGNLTEDEYLDLLLTLNVEAGGEGTLGMMMVLQVIINRVASDEWPDTIHGVISQKGQFCGYRLRESGTITQSELDAVNLFMEQEDNVFVPWSEHPSKVMYFCTPGAYEQRGSQYMKNIFRYGGHVFGE